MNAHSAAAGRPSSAVTRIAAVLAAAAMMVSVSGADLLTSQSSAQRGPSDVICRYIPQLCR